MPEPSGGESQHAGDDAHVERKAARGSVIVAIAQVLKGIGDAVGSLVLARVLLPADFGLVDMVVAITGIMDMLKDVGLSTATIQTKSIDREQVNALFWINVAVGLVLTVLTMALGPVLAIGYGRPELLEITVALALGTLLGAAAVQHLALLRRDLRFTALGMVDVVSALLATIAALIAAFRGFGAWALVVRQLVRLTVQLVLAFALSSFRPGRPRRADVRELLRFGKHLSGFQVVNYLERNADNVLVGKFVGAEPLGFYAKAYDIMRLPLNQVSGPISTVALPALSRLLATPERYRQTFEGLTRVLCLLLVPLAPVAILAAPWFIPTVLGPRWVGSVAIFQVLGVTLVTKPLTHAAAWLLVTQARTRELFQFGLVAGVIALASFVIGLRWGALGVAGCYAVVDIALRSPLLFAIVGRAGPVSTRDLLACAAPSWVLSALIAAGYLGLDFFLRLRGFPLGTRVALCTPASLLVATVLFLATPFGRAVAKDGVRLVRTLRASRS